MNIFTKEKEKRVKKKKTPNGLSSSMLSSINSLDNEISGLRKRKGIIEKSLDKTFADADIDKVEKAELRKKIQELSDDESRIRMKRKALTKEMKEVSEQENKVTEFKRKMSKL
jgi:hypothetical protein